MAFYLGIWDKCLENLTIIWELLQKETGKDTMFIDTFKSSGMPRRECCSWSNSESHLYLHLNHWTHNYFPLITLKICSHPHLLTKRVIQKASQITPTDPLLRRCTNCTSSSPIDHPGKIWIIYRGKHLLSGSFLRINGAGTQMQVSAHMCARTHTHTTLHTHLTSIKKVVSEWLVCALRGQNFLVNISENSILSKLTVRAKFKTTEHVRKSLNSTISRQWHY